MSTVARPRNNMGRSIDGICSFPNCDEPATDLIAQPICAIHCLKVYRAAKALVSDATPEQVIQAADLDNLGIVYFVKTGQRVKIGFATNLANRLSAIPHDRVLAAIPGSLADEKRAHLKFLALRDVGEWFRAEPELLEYVSRLRYNSAA